MTMSYTESHSFTLTHAKYLASKVVSDLYQCSRIYGKPTVDRVKEYETELVILLANGCIEEYEFGFKKDDRRIVSWRYTVDAGGNLVGGGIDDNAGGVYARAKVSDATYYNFMTYSSAWSSLPSATKTTIPISRGDGSLPSDGYGYWVSDRTYSNGGTSVARQTFRLT